MADDSRQVKIEVFPPAITERFALKLSMPDGALRKYVLPLSGRDSLEMDGPVCFSGFSLSDEIWAAAKLAREDGGEFPKHKVEFPNGFSIPLDECLSNSSAYTDSEKFDDLIFSDGRVSLRRRWRARANIWEWNKMYAALLSGNAFNPDGISAIFSMDGKRLTTLDFMNLSKLSNGLYRGFIRGYGYKIIDREGNTIPEGDAFYDYVGNDFNFPDEKFVCATRGGKLLLVDAHGKEIQVESRNPENIYKRIEAFSEGLARVSTVNFDWFWSQTFAYYSEYDKIAGIWGYVNERGEELISPQYIYATDFEEGHAIVCKGKWTIDKKWDNQYNSGRYWSEEMLWGVIDKSGREVVCCKYDEVKRVFSDEGLVKGVFQAHVGGWESGKWGLLDAGGNWIVEPIFDCDFGEYFRGLIEIHKGIDGIDYDCGVYDIKAKAILFEPKFEWISFLESGNFMVQCKDAESGKICEKIIDREGNELFHSEYCKLINDYDCNLFIAEKCLDGGRKAEGIIDEAGNIIVECKYDSIKCISAEHKNFIFEKDKKWGLCDFSGNVIIPAEYESLTREKDGLFCACINSEGLKRAGVLSIDNKILIPFKYDRISFDSNNCISCVQDRKLSEVFEYEVLE